MEELTIYENSNRHLTVSNSSISEFKDEILDAESFDRGRKVLTSAFPKLQPAWFNILKTRLSEKGFTRERFRKAVYNLIDTCQYPEPTIAQILNYDLRIETLTYSEILEKEKTYGNSIWNEYELIDIEGKCYYTPKGNRLKYGLKAWVSSPAEPKVIYRKQNDGKAWEGMFKDVLADLNKQIEEQEATK